MELIAQSYAAFKGYMDRMDGKPLARDSWSECADLEVTRRAYAGDRLLTSIRTVAVDRRVRRVEGAVTRGDETIASGTMKLWLVDDGRG